ncbi:MAG: GntR family transcriptional regulator [Rikenellaceae bacterium]
MKFIDGKPIYLQIVEYISDEIIANTWHEGERILSVRELGQRVGVNVNTCMRAYEQLVLRGVIESKRGLGYNVTIGAKESIITERRERFIRTTMPDFFRQMKLLHISAETIIQEYDKFDADAETRLMI